MASQFLNHANRGSPWEDLIAAANDLYLQEGRAIIHKVPTPWKVVGYDARRQHARQVFPERKSTVDYHGVLVGGRSIQFEAKQSDHTRGFPIDIDKIKPHQIEHLISVQEMGGEAFLLLWAAKFDTCWVIRPAIIERLRSQVVRTVMRGGRIPEDQYKASMAWKELDELGSRVPWRAGLPDYLAALTPEPA